MKIFYVVPMLGDAAVRRRVAMFTAGGAEVAVAGFNRQGQADPSFDGVEPVCLGQSFDARMLLRALLVAKAAFRLDTIEKLVRSADLIVARNLESLALAVLARKRFECATPIVYECLDIHRLMLSRSIVGRALRALERWLLARSSALIVSSPAFVDNYFVPLQGGGPPHMLVENRPLELDDIPAETPAHARSAGPPWRIGWFGVIRCRKSLDFLVGFARRRPDLLVLDIRGRPFVQAIPDIRRAVAGLDNVRFHGPYSAADLPSLYADVHFTWAIDFYEEGQNSDWLLPNRLYEGCSFGAVPIAMERGETGRWLNRRGLGLTLERLDQFGAMLETMTLEHFRNLEERVRAEPRTAFVATRQDCVWLLERLADLAFGQDDEPIS